MLSEKRYSIEKRKISLFDLENKDLLIELMWPHVKYLSVKPKEDQDSDSQMFMMSMIREWKKNLCLENYDKEITVLEKDISFYIASFLENEAIIFTSHTPARTSRICCCPWNDKLSSTESPNTHHLIGEPKDLDLISRVASEDLLALKTAGYA